MNATLGRLMAQLAESNEVTPDTDLVDRINTAINPPERVSIDDVHIRAMYIVSDEVNSFGGCFPSDEHERLCRLLVDSPVMVGHRKDRLPIGRTFHAATVDREGRRWVKCWFYWLKKAAGAETLRENIDGGVYKECSISFTFRLPECSICGKDIRLCQHQPFETYGDGGDGQVCHFRYRRIERVLETSLVYRGAVPNTAITREHVHQDEPTDMAEDTSVTDLENLPESETYTVVPAYDGLSVKLTTDGRLVSPETDLSLPGVYGMNGGDGPEPVGYLLGMRGKERCSLEALRRHLSEGDSLVSRLELRLLDRNRELPPVATGTYRMSIRPLRHRLCRRDQLADVTRLLATRDGVRIWPADRAPFESPAFSYNPEDSADLPSGEYRLYHRNGAPSAQLLLPIDGETARYDIRQFHLGRFRHGGRFVADRVDRANEAGSARQAIASGDITERSEDDGALVLTMTGKLAGTTVIRPITIQGRERFLVYRLMN